MSETAKGAEKAPDPPKQDSKAGDGKGSDVAKADGAKDTAKAAEPKRDAYHVVGPGSVMFGGKAYSAHKRINLTAEEAASLGENVKLGRPPEVAAEDIANRKGGKYKVTGPGSVWIDGKQRFAGVELELGQDDARSLGAAVTPAG